jgi:hypothetical protein
MSVRAGIPPSTIQADVHLLSDARDLSNAARILESSAGVGVDTPSVFCVLRHGGLVAILLMCDRLCPSWVVQSRSRFIWRSILLRCVEFLRGFGSLCNLHHAVDFASALSQRLEDSIYDIGGVILQFHVREQLLFDRVNSFLCRVPIDVIEDSLEDFYGFLSYVTVVQASIDIMSQRLDWSAFRNLSGAFIGFGFCEPFDFCGLANDFSQDDVGRTVVVNKFLLCFDRLDNLIASRRYSHGWIFEVRIPIGSFGVTNLVVAADFLHFVIAAGSSFCVSEVREITINSEGGSESHVVIPLIRAALVGDWSANHLALPPGRTCRCLPI